MILYFMPINKEIIIRLVSSFIFFAITFRVLGPIFFEFFKKKITGSHTHDSDIDYMIKRQQERLRAQYGITGDISTGKREEAPTKEIQQIYKETQWGGGAFVKEIQQEIAKSYSYTMADSKVNAFIHLCGKRNYVGFLSEENQSSSNAIKNYLVSLLLLFLLTEEMREKKFFLLEKIAKKLAISVEEFAIALQIKLLMAVALKKDLKEERIFTEVLVIGQYSEETIKEASESIAKKEANLWAKGPSLLFEELTLALNYASMISPMPKLKNRKDLETAYEILGASQNQNIDEIKKLYKKIALQKHPDKIVSLKLPKVLERKAIDRFNKIQEAYEIVIQSKK